MGVSEEDVDCPVFEEDDKVEVVGRAGLNRRRLRISERYEKFDRSLRTECGY